MYNLESSDVIKLFGRYFRNFATCSILKIGPCISNTKQNKQKICETRTIKMENFTSSLQTRDSEKSEDNGSDADWSDINTEDENGDDELDMDEGDRSLRIDLKDDEDAEISTPVQLQKLQQKSPNRKISLCGFTATAGSSKKSKL